MLYVLIFLGLTAKVKGDHHRKDGEELISGQAAGNGQVEKTQGQKQGDQILDLHHAVQELFHKKHLTGKEWRSMAPRSILCRAYSFSSLSSSARALSSSLPTGSSATPATMLSH